jgi:beta-N-acetylhexosaminidase
VLAEMTPAQRIGQLFFMGLPGNQLGDVERRAIEDQHIGSVWFTAQTEIGVAALRSITDAVQAQATTAATGGVGFFVAANQEGGLIQALTGPGFSTIPSAVEQGAESRDTITADALVWGQELLAAGVNLDFAPVADVVPPGADATNEPIGALSREYGHDPLTAGNGASDFIAGLTKAGVATTAKHFPGLGRVMGNTDFTAQVVDEETTPDDPYLDSFRAAIDAEVPFVMVALATYTQIDPTRLAAFSPIVIGQLLRGDLGFQGVVMSDDLADTAAVASLDPGQRAVAFILAGGDLVVSRSASATVAMVAALQAQASDDATFVTRLNEAALRVLEAKEAAGLLPC